jgi:hypothetical protein
MFVAALSLMVETAQRSAWRTAIRISASFRNYELASAC